MKSPTSTADLAAASAALEAFLQAFVDRDYGEALEYAQVTWRTNLVDAKGSLKRALLGIMPDEFEITSVSQSPGHQSDVPAVFSDCMVDIPYSMNGVSDGRELTVEGTARVICETGYMQPDPAGDWGVNPVSLTRVSAKIEPVV